MLVLSRKTQEQIVIGGDIIITVVRVAGGRVQLGVEAPAHVSIKRSELEERSRTAVSLPSRFSSCESVAVG
jgi:carbon storage regulator